MRSKQNQGSYDHQIHGYLTTPERIEFKTYAEKHELDVSALARLLLVRELRLGRLSELLSRHPAHTGSSVKVTAHLKDLGVKNAFVSQAAAIGATASAAAGAIFRAELAEKWLSRVVLVTDCSTQLESDIILR